MLQFTFITFYLSFVIIFLSINLAVCQIQILTPLDLKTKTFPLSPFNRNSSTGTLVGQVLAQDRSNLQRKIEYSLLDVSYVLANGIIMTEKVKGSSRWKIIASTISRNDCDESNLSNYPEFRRYFCINHFTGDIFITKYFIENRPPTGSTFQLTIKYTSGPLTYSTDVNPYSVTIFSSCDLMMNLLEDMRSQCDNSGILEQRIPPESNNTKVAGLTVRIKPANTKSIMTYLSTIRIDFSWLTTSSLGGTANIIVSYIYENLTGSVIAMYTNPNVYLFRLNIPIKVETGKDIRIHIEYKSALAGWYTFKDLKFYQGNVSLLYLEETNDYCSATNAIVCTDFVDRYYISYLKNILECRDKDDGLFISKYGFCKDNPAPVITNNTASFDYDIVERTKQPVHIISNYVINAPISVLKFKILNVTAKYQAPSQMISTVGHPDCTSDLQNVPLPFGYFCLNQTTGALYTTKATVRNILSDEEFNLTLQIYDVEVYPPRITEGTIKITLKSVCKNTTALYRDFYTRDCDKEYRTATIRRSSSNTGSYEIDITGAQPNENYYITGITKITPVLNLDPSQFGSYIKFQLQVNADVMEARHYFIGTFSSFNFTIKHQTNHKYIISQTFYNGRTNSMQNDIFNPNMWKLVLIKEKDYCTNQDTCIESYSKYEKEYERKRDQLIEYCIDPRIDGSNIKYGYCDRSNTLTFNRTEYTLNVKQPYSLIEVIPATSTMYTSQTGLTYALINVQFNGINQSSPLPNNNNLHDDCTSEAIGFFCISRVTGKIYTTRDSAGRLKLNDRFELTVQITDPTKFPLRQLESKLTLLTRDFCSPASNTYESLSTCNNFKAVSTNYGFTGGRKAVVFNIPDLFQSVLAVVIPIRALELSSNTSGSIRVNIKHQHQNGTTDISNTSSLINNFNKVSVPMYIPGVRKSDKIIVTVFEISIAIPVASTEVVFTDNGSIELEYIESFNCDVGCIEIYERWKREARMKDANSSNNCEDDELFYKRNFEICINSQPIFKSAPSITDSITTGSTVTLNNCIYNSPYEFPDSYWLKNGVERINITIRNRRDLLNDYPYLLEHRVGGLNLNNVGLNDQGYYQCVVSNGKVMFMSEKVYLKLTDVSETRFTVNMISEKWDERFLDKSSIEYQSLEKRLNRELGNELSSDGCCGESTNRRIQIDEFFGETTTNVKGRIYFSDSAPSQRLSYCQQISTVLKDGNLDTIQIQNLKLTNIDCCLTLTEGDRTFKGQYTFPTTITGNISINECAYGSNVIDKKIERLCVLDAENGAEWGPLELSFCKPQTNTTMLLLDLALQPITADNVEDASRNLSVIVKRGKLTSKHDVDIIVDIMKSIVDVGNPTDQVTDNVLETIDDLLEMDENLLIEANQDFNTSISVLTQLEILAQNQQLNTTGQNKTIEKNNIAFVILKPIPNKPVRVFSPRAPQLGNLQIDITQEPDVDELAQALVYLPVEVIEKAENEDVYFYVFRSDKLFLNEAVKKNQVNTTVLQSAILSATVGTKRIENLTEHIELTYTTRVLENVTGESKCMFWDVDMIDSSNNLLGGWSTEGCITSIGENPNQIKCTCNHLTSFAILLDVSQSGKTSLAMEIITYIGCGVSLAGLFLTIVTFLVIPSLRRKLPSKILISLCLSLMAVLIIFLAGVEETSPRSGCQVVAALLQYFILTTFFWMAVEGLNLYRNFVKVFGGRSSGTKFMIKASLFAWGIPLIIVAITAGVVPDNLGPENEDHAQFCVLRGTPFYFALLLPICLILLGNFIVLILVLRGIRSGSNVSKMSKRDENTASKHIRIAFACSVLLGSTWLFGILAVSELTEFFQWLFCIFNSLQGLFIFVFYCLRSKEIQRQWKRFFGGQGFDSQSRSTQKSRYNTYKQSQKRSLSTSRSDSKKEVNGVNEVNEENPKNLLRLGTIEVEIKDI